MPRKRGDRNLVDTQIAKLRALGYVITGGEGKKHEQTTVDAAIPEQGAAVVDVAKATKPVTFELPKAKPKGEITRYICGVRICGYSQRTPFVRCPKCGATNEWGE